MSEEPSDSPFSTSQRPLQLVALGDSMSIDLYPGRDHGQRGPHPDRPSDGLGAVSLLVRNRDDVWPEFAGRDLTSLVDLRPDDVLDLTADGATTFDVLDSQLERVSTSSAPTIVTLTAGGNDLLQTLVAPGPDDESLVAGIPDRLAEILEGIRQRRPASRILVGTIYDPSDGSDRLSVADSVGHFPTQGGWLRATNAAIRTLCATAGADLIDIERHFLGHGGTSDDCWLWPDLIFEPGARGASEVRRLWLDALADE